MSRVGTLIVGNTWRMSISMFMRASWPIADGLALCRWKRANQSMNSSSSARLGASHEIARSASARVPNAASRSGMLRSHSSRGGASGKSGAHVARGGDDPYSTAAVVLSGYVAAKRSVMATPSETPISAARSEPAASMTARTSSMRVSSCAIPVARSESPVPRLSNMMSRPRPARPSNRRAHDSHSQASSTFEM